MQAVGGTARTWDKQWVTPQDMVQAQHSGSGQSRRWAWGWYRLHMMGCPLSHRAYFPGQEQQVRLIYQGQLLRDDAQSLAALHLAPNSVLHCHISQHSPAPAPAGPRASADPVHTALNVGSLMLPLFVLMLAVLWYFQLQYRHVFTATATTFLAGLTLLFSFMAFTMYRR